MTRVNLVPPQELHRLHLVAEYRELPRVFALARPVSDAPERYTLGTGHVKFFYNKLLFLTIRHRLLVLEMERRGYSPAYRDVLELLSRSCVTLCNNYHPSPEEVEISRHRLALRTLEIAHGGA